MSTLADLKRENWTLYGHCTARNCGHGRAIDLDMLIERFGPDFVFINETGISRRLRCKCGHLGGTVRVTAPGKAQR